MKKALLLSLLLFLAISSVFCSDTSYVKVEEKDWLAIQEYVTNSQTQLKEAQSELIKLKTELSQSLNLVQTLKTSSLSMQESLKKTQSWNKILIGTTVVSLAINVVFIFLITR